jgi:hypothetical protein
MKRAHVSIVVCNTDYHNIYSITSSGTIKLIEVESYDSGDFQRYSLEYAVRVAVSYMKQHDVNILKIYYSPTAEPVIYNISDKTFNTEMIKLMWGIEE